MHSQELTIKQVENGIKCTVNQSETSSCQAEQKQRKTEDHHSVIKELRKNGQKLRSDSGQPDLSVKPPWFDEALFENAKSVYDRHFMAINFAHLSGLLLLVRVNSIYRTLSVTDQSNSVAKLFNRYYRTILHVKKWYEGDIFEENSEAYRSLLIVRGMHNKVSSSLNGNSSPKTDETITCSDSHKQWSQDEKYQLISNNRQYEQEEEGVHLSEYDIMITQFAFIGFIVTRAKNMGLIDDFCQKDLWSLLHFWRVIGFYLGASDKFNLCSYELNDIAGLCEAITEIEYKKSIAENPISSSPGIMSLNIVRSVKFIPMLTIYGIMRYLYELLDIDTSEFSDRETGYSRLSYKLIKLVMSRLLAYRALRSFNNGLTRLSIYLVGKIETWFTYHLESKYGQELKL